MAYEHDESLPLASADAMVEEDGITVWEWDFEKLKNVLGSEREVSNALSAYVNHDLRRKLIDTGVSMSDLDNIICDKTKASRKEKPNKKS